ncbi:MAG: sensor histidine kinase N-terminal domain-containing protein, partial [Planctomycetes bacterium]|nr:sensor histidine kinase N-terminal domain-containing protein [Planctomycetota bacterium]
MSLRARLLTGTIAGTATVLLCAGIVLYWVIRERLWNEFDQALCARASSLASLVEQEDDDIEVDVDYRAMPEFDQAERPEYLQIWLGDGTTLVRSPSLGAGNLAPPPPEARYPFVSSVGLPDGRPGRFVAIAAFPRLDSPGKRVQPRRIVVGMAKATADLVATLGRIRWLMIAVALAALGLSAGLLFATVGRGMRPLDRLAGTIGGLRPDDLSSRIDLGPLPGELVPVVDQMNSLLARIEAAVQREKAFTADVAHELRTPLAGLRSTLEVSLSRERDSQAYRADLSECLKINGQMQA